MVMTGPVDACAGGAGTATPIPAVATASITNHLETRERITALSPCRKVTSIFRQPDEWGRAAATGLSECAPYAGVESSLCPTDGATRAASQVVRGTELTRPMLPTRVRTISTAADSPLATEASDCSDSTNRSMSGSDAPT